MRHLSMGLRTEVVASVTLLTLVAILLVGALMLQAFHGDYLSQQIRSAHRILKTLRSVLIEMAGGDLQRVPEEVRSDAAALLEEVAEGEGMKLLWVNAQGDVLAGRSSASTVGRWTDPDLQSTLRTGQGTTRIEDGKGWWPLLGTRQLVLTSPILSARGKVQGALRMEVSLWGVGGGFMRSRWVLALYMLLAMGILVLFGSYMISRNVLRPLRRLILASEKIAHGDYALTWEGYPAHEMGRLADALRRMALSLQEQQRALTRQVQDLERSNRALLQAHQALVRSEKLASVGRLAAGVAHEIGNPIGSILGYLEILLREADNRETTDCLERIHAEAERIQRTLRSLLDLARPAGQQWGWVDLESTVDETLSLMAGHDGIKGIEVKWEPIGGLNPIWADRDQIQQVVVNLLLNALDALGGQGTMTIRVGNTSRLPHEGDLVPPPRRRGEPIDADYTSLRRTPPTSFLGRSGPYAYIRVEDTGPGIPSENFQELFEPFYTTKETGKGTGLGLSVCLGIVESYGGRIQVKSQPGEGSAFTVYFPVGEGPAEGEDGGPVRERQ